MEARNESEKGGVGRDEEFSTEEKLGFNSRDRRCSSIFAKTKLRGSILQARSKNID